MNFDTQYIIKVFVSGLYYISYLFYKHLIFQHVYAHNDNSNKMVLEALARLNR